MWNGTSKSQSPTLAFTEFLRGALSIVGQWNGDLRAGVACGRHGEPRHLEVFCLFLVVFLICILSYYFWPVGAAWRTQWGLCPFFPSLLVGIPFWLGPLELTSSIVLVILDEERDGVKHILLSHVVALGAVICFFDVIMFYTGVLTETNEHTQSLPGSNRDTLIHLLASDPHCLGQEALSERIGMQCFSLGMLALMLVLCEEALWGCPWT